MKKHPHINMLATVARGLGDLNKEVVFVGGATVGLHITDPAAPEVRVSDDVDCVIEITSLNRYHELEEKLRQRGFKDPHHENHPICRYEFSGIIVDIMPTEGKILGFSNRWYRGGIKHAKKIQLPGGPEISIFSTSYLMASKIEAFKDRGKGDFLGSSDMEDIMALVDGCETLQSEIEKADQEVKNYIRKEIRQLLANDRFLEAAQAHIGSIDRTGDRTDRAISILKSISLIQ